MPDTFDLILKNGKCFIDGQLKTVDIGISNGIIKSISKIDETTNQKILDANDLVVLPTEMKYLISIRDLQVHDNKLIALPEYIGDMDSLRRFDGLGQ